MEIGFNGKEDSAFDHAMWWFYC